jgi:hypothetical protein
MDELGRGDPEIRGSMMDVFEPQQPQSSLIASICRCSSPHEHAQRAASYAAESASASVERAKRDADAQVQAANARAAELAARSPNPDSFAIEDVEQVGEHLVMRVKYPNCAKCAYEGSKVIVFLDVTLKHAIKWRRIDPHFRDPRGNLAMNEAPSPAARFPASKEGWSDALAYARGKER